MNIAIITLGCSKNTVDSEQLAGLLKRKSITVKFDNVAKADVAIVNTCGFITDAKEESIDTILNCVRMKSDKRFRLKKIFVIGCLVEINKSKLKKSIPEVDDWFGSNCIDKIAKALLNDNDTAYFGNRLLSTPKHFAYIKIAEGCNKKCSFCAIPLIRGNHISRPKEDILSEATFLRSNGAKELIVISQDLTYYGIDNYKSLALPSLIKEISKLGFLWIRLHYAHPNEINDDVLNLFNSLPNVCKYLDIPLQHVNSDILKSMNRNINRENTIALVEHIRKTVPNIAIRTTFIVGFPGETKEQFEELVRFVKEMRFERLGVFTFSCEEGTIAATLNDDVPEEEKQYRKNKLLEVQQQISLEYNCSKIGKNLMVIIDRQEDDYYVGRTEYDSPEVDNEVIIFSKEIMKVGYMYNVTVTDADYFDLIARYD